MHNRLLIKINIPSLVDIDMVTVYELFLQLYRDNATDQFESLKYNFKTHKLEIKSCESIVVDKLASEDCRIWEMEKSKADFKIRCNNDIAAVINFSTSECIEKFGNMNIQFLRISNSDEVTYGFKVIPDSLLYPGN